MGQVEGVLYRVHSHFLCMHSPVFKDMFEMELPPDQVPDGMTDSKPIVLEQVTAHDFDLLLWIFYNP